MTEIRCYQCKHYRGGQYHGKCVNPAFPKPAKCDAVDFCDKGEPKEAATR